MADGRLAKALVKNKDGNRHTESALVFTERAAEDTVVIKILQVPLINNLSL